MNWTVAQKDFESKYHYKIVKPRGNYYKLPIKEYIVTSALLNWEDDGKTTIFAIKALDYNLENKHWITLKIAAEELDARMDDFEIIRDGYEDYVKPKILEEILMSWGEKNNETIELTSSIYTPGKGYPSFKDKLGLNTVTRNVFSGLEEYMFIYKSVFDIDKPSCYIVRLPPNFQYRQEIEEWVKPFRQDVLDNKVAYGMNQRLGFVKINEN